MSATSGIDWQDFPNVTGKIAHLSHSYTLETHSLNTH